MNKSIFNLKKVMIYLLFAASGIFLCNDNQSFAQSYSFFTIDYPGASETFALGINNDDKIVGRYIDDGGIYHGFIKDGNDFITLDYPGAHWTMCTDINDLNQIVGEYRYEPTILTAHGFFKDDASFTNIDFPNAIATMTYGINNDQQKVGIYINSSYRRYGYLEVNGNFSTIYYPGSILTYAFDINNLNQIVGGYSNIGGLVEHGFRFENGNFSSIDFPGASKTWVSGVNNLGTIVGAYEENNNQIYTGFLFEEGEFSIINFPDAPYTVAYSINDKRHIVGYYRDDSGNHHGFLATPLVSDNRYYLPDTGQTKCYDNSSEITCQQPGEAFYGQDAHYTINPPSYTKLDAFGNSLPDSATEWVMVRDNVTGLIWEVKTDDGSIHDKDDIYSWQDAQDVFIAQLNSSNFGGNSDWRVPTVKELSSILNMGTFNPAINTHYFPNTGYSPDTVPTQYRFYWSSTIDANYTGYAWCVRFYYGLLEGHEKFNSYYVRAVRGGITENSFIDNEDGTIKDTATGLTWQKGTAGPMTWEDALAYCENLELAGYSDWRLPNRNELESIVDFGRFDPAVDTVYFPDTVSSFYWSSTTDTYYTYSAWFARFYNGFVGAGGKLDNWYVRVVRGGTEYQNQPPSAPQLSWPDDGKVNVNPKTLVLEWEASTDPDGDNIEYCVSIKDVEDDETIEIGCYYDIYYPETWFALPETLGLGSFTTYQWSVKARDSNGNLSPASQPRTFTTANMIYGLFVGIRYDDFRGDTSAQLLRERFDRLPGVAYPTELLASDSIPESQIANRIEYLQNERLKPGDTLFLYITGHGCPAYDKEEPNQSGNEPANPPDGPVLTSEDEFIPINGNDNCGALFWNSEKLTDDELYAHLSIIEAGINKWIFIDSCDSGGFWGDPENPNADEGDLEKLENASLCAAATETTKSYAISVPENGQMSEPLSLFAVALSDGFTLDTNGNYKIDRAPQDDNVTFTEMTSWLQDWVANVHPTWAGQIVIEMDAGDPVIFSLDMWSPFFAKTDDFVESLSVGSVNSLVADAMGPYIGVTNFPITFNASGSYDPDGEIVSYEWDFDNDGIFEVSVTTPTTNFTYTTEYYTTEYNGIVTLRVTNNDGMVATDTASVEVAHDTTPPKMVISASPDVLWPPNHKMTSVTVSADAIDNCGVEPTCQIISVESNEPIDGLGDDDKSPDWEITGDLTVNLRAERSDEGDGRIYTITVECTDASSNIATETTEVTVPHDKGN